MILVLNYNLIFFSLIRSDKNKSHLLTKSPILPREKMDEYYNYVNNNSPPPDFKKDDPDNNKFDEMIKKLINDDYNDMKRERLSSLYKNCLLYTSPSPRD